MSAAAPIAAPPTPSTFSSELYRGMWPLAQADEQEGWALRTYCEAIGLPFEWVWTYGLDSDFGPGWSMLMSPWTCPPEGLPWLGQFVGVVVNPSLTLDQQRAQVAQHIGFRRGTPQAIIAAAQATLTGTRRVWLAERLDGEAYHLGATTRIDETLDPAATEAAIRAALPAGITLDFNTVLGQSYDEAGEGRTYDDWKAAYPTYDDLRKGT